MRKPRESSSRASPTRPARPVGPVTPNEHTLESADMPRIVFAAFFFTLSWSVPLVAQQSAAGWKAHDPDRPKPHVVTPGALGTPPSDAIVLFDGRGLTEWTATDGAAAGWTVRDGYMETAP